jgi:hypothetical protein
MYLHPSIYDRALTRGCVITVALNPLLDAVGFWRILERVVFFAFGITPRGAQSAS